MSLRSPNRSQAHPAFTIISKNESRYQPTPQISFVEGAGRIDFYSRRSAVTLFPMAFPVNRRLNEKVILFIVVILVLDIV